MYSIIKNWSTKSCDEMEDPNIDIMTTIEESGRGCRSKRKQIDPTCCPVCSITLRVSELDSHLVTEIDKLSKLSVKHKRNPKWAPSLSTSNNSLGKGWETYQKIKMNRQVRLKVKSKKRKNDEITCPVCNEVTTEDITIHVEMCLQRVDKVDDTGSEEENIDVEGFEEYEWAGQTRIRASSLLEGGFAGTGIGLSVTKPGPDEEDADVVVDGDDTHMYGSAQYTDSELINISDMTQTEEKENCNDGCTQSMNTYLNKETDSSLNSVSFTVMDALKSKIRELEARDQNRELYKCLICMGVYSTPVVSICCWHVHCEQCWLKTLATKKLCPQCNMITSPLDLRKIYI